MEAVKINATQYKTLIAKLDWLMATRHDDFKDVHRKLDELTRRLDRYGTDAEWMGRVITKLDAIQGAVLHEDFVNHQASGGKSKTRRTVPVNLTPSRPRKLQVTK